MNLQDALSAIEDGLEAEDVALVLEGGRQLREHLSAMLADRRLEAEDRALARRRRLHQRLEVLEAKAQAGRFEDAEEDLEAVEDLAWRIDQDLEGRERVDEDAEAARRPRLAAAFWIAEREARDLVGSLPGAVLAVLSVLVFSLGLQAALEARPGGLELLWANARDPVLVLAPLAGLVAGLGVLGPDARAGSTSMLAAGSLPRWGIVLAKSTGAFAALALLLAGPALLAAAAGLALGLGPAPAITLAALAGVVLSATSFAAIALAFEAWHGRSSTTLAGTVAAYLCLGPVWEAAFAAGRGGGPTVEAMIAAIVHRASPVVAAGNAFLPAVEPRPSPPTVALLVLLAWTLAGTLWAARRAQRDGFTRERQA